MPIQKLWVVECDHEHHAQNDDPDARLFIDGTATMRVVAELMGAKGWRYGTWEYL